MKKTILIILVLIVIAIAGGVYYFVTHLDSLIKEAIEKYGSQATQTSVRVQHVKTSIKQTSVAIGGLSIANPDGFSTPNAFSLGKISTRVDFKASSKKKIVIDNILIHAPEIFYEVNADRKGNLNILKDRLAGGSRSTSGSGGTGKSADVPLISIHKFEFSGAALHALLVPLKNKQYDLKIPAFTLTNLHGTPEQISRQVLNRIIDRARDEIRRRGIDAELDKAKAKLKARVDEEKAKAQQKVDTRMEEEKAKAQDKLKSLIGK